MLNKLRKTLSSLTTLKQLIVVIVGITLTAVAPAALAQRGYRAAGGGLACCGTSFFAVLIGLVALNIAILVWVAKDAKNRGMENSIVWMLLVIFTGFIGLIIYFFSRPKGELVACRNCQLMKLPPLVRCPHCGAAA